MRMLPSATAEVPSLLFTRLRHALCASFVHYLRAIVSVKISSVFPSFERGVAGRRNGTRRDGKRTTDKRTTE